MTWLNSTEMFARPSKQIPGKWQLFEYYTDTSNKLVHFTDDMLKANNEFWNISFAENKNYSHQCELPDLVISNIKDGNWSISKNYITLSFSEKEPKSIEFQFAIEKGVLKLLKKDASGLIEFFGFFKKI